MLKHLRNVARNIAHKFSVSANHFAYLASSGCSKSILLDFITQEIHPEEYSIERNHILLSQCKENLERIVSQEEMANIKKAYLIVDFCQKNSDSELSGSYKFTFELVNGKNAVGIVNAVTLIQK